MVHAVALSIFLCVGAFSFSLPSTSQEPSTSRRSISVLPSHSTLTHHLHSEAKSLYAMSSSPSTLEVAQMQWGRLFGKDNRRPITTPQLKDKCTISYMRQHVKIIRTLLSWVFLFIAKVASISAPIYFKGLVNTFSVTGASDVKAYGSTLFLGYSAMGMIIGYGLSKFSSSIAQFLCEVLLSPVTKSAASALPIESFRAALHGASRRNEGTSLMTNNNASKSISQAKDAAGGVDENMSGYARRALDRGLRASNQFIYRSIFNLLPSLIETSVVLAVIFLKVGKLVGMTALIVAALFVFATTTVMNRRLPILRNQLREEGLANGYVEDALNLAETVAAYGAAVIEEDRYNLALENVGNAAMKVRFSYSVLKIIQALILTLGSTAIIYTACIVSVKRPLSSSETIGGQLVLVSSLFSQLCGPLEYVGQHFRDCVAAAEDLRELETIRRNFDTEGCGDKYNGKQLAPRATRQSGGRAAYKEAPPRIEIKDLSFAYKRFSRDVNITMSRNVLNDVNIVLKPGGYSLGIVGPSGCGKSTLLRVLLGLESINTTSSSTRIIIDGVDVTNLERTHCFSIIGQDNDLFRGLSLEDNVKYGLFENDDNDASIQQALENAAMDSQLLPVLDGLNGGWKASVGPRGRLLSGGERQRVCLARALFREEMGSSILLMDEATSNLDAITENLVTTAIAKRVKLGATAMIVAHRLSSVQNCDMILVLGENGNIDGRGTHEELLNNNEWYSKSWSLQSKHAATATAKIEGQESEKAA